MTTAPPRLLSLDELLDRVDRLGDRYGRGLDIQPDPDLEHTIQEHGWNELQVVTMSVQRDERRARARAAREARDARERQQGTRP